MTHRRPPQMHRPSPAVRAAVERLDAAGFEFLHALDQLGRLDGLTAAGAAMAMATMLDELVQVHEQTPG